MARAPTSDAHPARAIWTHHGVARHNECGGSVGGRHCSGAHGYGGPGIPLHGLLREHEDAAGAEAGQPGMGTVGAGCGRDQARAAVMAVESVETASGDRGCGWTVAGKPRMM